MTEQKLTLDESNNEDCHLSGGSIASAWIRGVSVKKQYIMQRWVWATGEPGNKAWEKFRSRIFPFSLPPPLHGHLSLVYHFPLPTLQSLRRTSMIMKSQGRFCRQQVPMRKSINPWQRTPVWFWRYWALAENHQFAQHALGKHLSRQNKNKSKI